MTDTITVQEDGGIATVRLDRPERHNAMTPAMIADLTETFRHLDGADSVRVVVLTGEGRSFCAGADLGYMRAAADYSFAENVADGEAIFDLMDAVATCRRPVVGRINGAAIGGGVGLVACCDITIAVDRALFAFSETRLGILPAVISPFVIARIGTGAARELFLTGERFDAARAREVGLVSHVVADVPALDEAVAARIAALLQAAPGAQAEAKALLRYLSAVPREDVRAYTSRLIAERRDSAEGREGMSAFLEKRRPWWQQAVAPDGGKPGYKGGKDE